MNPVDLIDTLRESFMTSADAPSRAVVYHIKSTSTDIPLNALISGGEFTKEQKENIGNYQYFGNLKLTLKPHVDDTITYDGIVWGVSSPVKLGTLWGVMGEKTRKRVK